MKLHISFLLVIFLTSCRLLGFPDPRNYEYLEAADELSRQGKFNEAISAYRKHMTYRFSLEDRPEWENPYLYLLLIGDLQLKLLNPEEALVTYELAEKNKVDSALVADRYRFLASWYQNSGNPDKAIEILGLYRDRDPLLFDVMRDRIAKEIVRTESLTPPSSTKSPSVSESGRQLSVLDP